METKRVLIILTVVLATMVVSLTSFIAGMFIPRPGFAPGNMPPGMNQPGNPPGQPGQPGMNQPPAQRPPLPGKKPSTFRVGKPYDIVMQRNKPVIAVFYVDWCHFCQAFMPKFDELYKKYRSKMSFTMVNCEDPKNANVVKEYNITAYPTVFFIDPKTKEKEQVNSSSFQSEDTLKAAIDKYLEEHPAK